jgi:SAM-dependent methyltransferase
MAKIEPFEYNAKGYEDWFDKNRAVYQSEIKALRGLFPKYEEGIEIGVGSGRFALPLGIRFGLDPSPQMRKLAIKREIQIVGGIAEALPFRSASFDLVLMVSTICFLDDVEVAFKETYRILQEGGYLLIALFDKGSLAGQTFIKEKKDTFFFKEAKFYSSEEINFLLKKIGFHHFKYKQTLFQSPLKIKTLEPIKEGYGQGLFVVIKAQK